MGISQFARPLIVTGLILFPEFSITDLFCCLLNKSKAAIPNTNTMIMIGISSLRFWKYDIDND
jgi:hypothetical protein